MRSGNRPVLFSGSTQDTVVIPEQARTNHRNSACAPTSNTRKSCEHTQATTCRAMTRRKVDCNCLRQVDYPSSHVAVKVKISGQPDRFGSAQGPESGSDARLSLQLSDRRQYSPGGGEHVLCAGPGFRRVAMDRGCGLNHDLCALQDRLGRTYPPTFSNHFLISDVLALHGAGSIYLSPIPCSQSEKCTILQNKPPTDPMIYQGNKSGHGTLAALQLCG